MQTSVPFVAYIPGSLAQAINYPGEARYLALMPGLNSEIWYDDGTYTGLARVTLSDLLAQGSIALHAPLFSKRAEVSPYWFLFDQWTQALFIGAPESVTAFIERNTLPILSYPHREEA